LIVTFYIQHNATGVWSPHCRPA